MRPLLVSVAVSLLAGLQLPRPDFSGTWVYVEPSSGLPAGITFRAPVFGREFTAKQDAESITIERVSSQQRFTVAYRLDGSETASVEPGGFKQPDLRVISRAGWTDEILSVRSVVERTVPATATKPESIRTSKALRRLRLQPDGTLAIESEDPLMASQRALAVYRKK